MQERPTGQSLGVLLLQPHLLFTHTLPFGLIVQSGLPVQPHTPALQAVPFALPTQVKHAMPVAPHWVWAVPATQVFTLQHPPLHAV